MHQRLEGKIGNLGFDLDSDELLRRAKRVLALANVEESDFDFIYVEREPGSMASVLAKSPEALRKAIIKVGALRYKFDDNQGRVVWMGVARTREENMENRRVHSLYDLIVALEHTRPKADQGAVEKNISQRSVKVDKHLVAMLPFHGPVRLTTYARNRWSGDECTDLVEMGSL